MNSKFGAVDFRMRVKSLVPPASLLLSPSGARRAARPRREHAFLTRQRGSKAGGMAKRSAAMQNRAATVRERTASLFGS